MWLTLAAMAAVVLAAWLAAHAMRQPLDQRIYDPPMVRHLRIAYPPDDGEGET